MIEVTMPLCIGFASRITKENEDGEDIEMLEIVTRITERVTDEELLEIKKIQEEATEKISTLFKPSSQPHEKGYEEQ